MRVIALLALCVAVVAAVPGSLERMPSGVVTVDQYPTTAAVLFSEDFVYYRQSCGGTILNNRSILTAAHCTELFPPTRFRIRVGSSWADSGGDVYIVQTILEHPEFKPQSPTDMDIGILQSATAIIYNSNVKPASIAGPNYFLADNEIVWAVGWVASRDLGFFSRKLHHAQIYKFSQDYCNPRIFAINDNLICAGVPEDVTQYCPQIAGDPLFHKGVVVGVNTYTNRCQHPQFPGTYLFVPRASNWIAQNA